MRKNVIYAVQPVSGPVLCLDFYYRSKRDKEKSFLKTYYEKLGGL